MYDSYEYTEPDQFLIHTRYYRRFFWEDKEDEDDKPLPDPFWRNVEWLKEKLAFDGIRYEDHVRKDRKERFLRKYGGESYDLRSAEDAIRLYNAITGKDEKLMTAEEFAKKLKERKMKYEHERCDLGRDRVDA